MSSKPYFQRKYFMVFFAIYNVLSKTFNIEKWYYYVRVISLEYILDAVRKPIYFGGERPFYLARGILTPMILDETRVQIVFSGQEVCSFKNV